MTETHGAHRFRIATPEQTPRNAAALARKARAAGWAVAITYAEGEHVAVRARRGPLRVAAIWTDGGFGTCLVRYDGPPAPWPAHVPVALAPLLPPLDPRPIRMFRVLGYRAAVALVEAGA